MSPLGSIKRPFARTSTQGFPSFSCPQSLDGTTTTKALAAYCSSVLGDMARDEDTAPSSSNPSTPVRKRKHELDNALELGPRKKACHSDPLVHYGRHFGRTVHAMCNIHVLLINGLFRDAADNSESEESESDSEKIRHSRERKIYRELLRIVPGLERRMSHASEEGLRHIAELLQKGVSSARSDDTKSLKSAVLDWITPGGVPLIPPLARNVKSDRGFHHEATGALLCPADMDWKDPKVKQTLRSSEYTVTGDQWPILLYQNYFFDGDNPWNGLFRSSILLKAYKFVFTSPSSVEKEPKATRSGNARIHGMEQVTIPSLAYVATLLRFSLSSSSIFSKTDKMTDSQRFYNSVVEFLEDPYETKEVNDLLAFWNRQIFPEFASTKETAPKDSALFRLRQRRAALRERCINRG